MLSHKQSKIIYCSVEGTKSTSKRVDEIKIEWQKSTVLPYQDYFVTSYYTIKNFPNLNFNIFS